ncbi:hypothetical protein GOP47_0011769 [Adiantum capillus-veneris]|uniref:Uncharacterized protein n=1 Tax=Adiantum capillus-veneris TaxID=13818 RepID=A0A9D4UTW2_ADICA|nr:hypothetical protein GOP47_0011769 [Adiantum capillus-veneris]
MDTFSCLEGEKIVVTSTRSTDGSSAVASSKVQSVRGYLFDGPVNIIFHPTASSSVSFFRLSDSWHSAT